MNPFLFITLRLAARRCTPKARKIRANENGELRGKCMWVKLTVKGGVQGLEKNRSSEKNSAVIKVNNRNKWITGITRLFCLCFLVVNRTRTGEFFRPLRVAGRKMCCEESTRSLKVWDSAVSTMHLFLIVLFIVMQVEKKTRTYNKWKKKHLRFCFVKCAIVFFSLSLYLFIVWYCLYPFFTFFFNTSGKEEEDLQ